MEHNHYHRGLYVYTVYIRQPPRPLPQHALIYYSHTPIYSWSFSHTVLTTYSHTQQKIGCVSLYRVVCQLVSVGIHVQYIVAKWWCALIRINAHFSASHPTYLLNLSLVDFEVLPGDAGHQGGDLRESVAAMRQGHGFPPSSQPHDFSFTQAVRVAYARIMSFCILTAFSLALLLW